jgi:hypothetical protein
MLLYIICVGAAVATFLALRSHLTAKTRRALPPGPKGPPVIGNMLDFVSDSPWLIFDKWFKQYGETRNQLNCGPH